MTPSAGGTDAALQSTAGPASATVAATSVMGIGVGLGSFSPQYAPPDTNSDVGPNNIMEVVNVDLAIWAKTGQLQFGPVATNTLFSSLSGGCRTNNDGDATVKYDRLSGRWIVQQFSISTTPYLECIAVSQTSNPVTTSWNEYEISGLGSYMPDYPKLGIWPASYVVTWNRFYRARSFSGPEVCALDSSAMQSGSSSVGIQCFTLSTSYASLLPADVDGGSTMAPPSTEPEVLAELGSNSLNFWTFPITWGTTPTSSLNGPTNLPVSPFSEACGGGTCVPQPGTSQQLDSLGDRLMYRLAYRHFPDGHEEMVVTHSVTAGNSTGIRWYELGHLTNLDSTTSPIAPSIDQQGTYAPDGNYRWMGSAAMDQSGDIAVGYSESNGSSLHPSLYYTGWQSNTGSGTSDPINTLEAETNLVTGGGSQLPNLNRWGDYSSMAVDPADDCTFWFAGEYLQSNGTWNWSTQIGSFKFPNCGSSASTAANLTFSPSTSQNLTAGQPSTAMTVTTNTPASSTVTVTLSTSSPLTGGGGFSGSASGSWSPTLQVLIPANTQTSEPFYYEDTVAGSPNLTASASGWTSGTQTEFVGPGPLATISVSPSPASVGTNQSTTLTASGADQYGNVQNDFTPNWTVTPTGLGSVTSPGLTTTFTAGSSTGSGTITATDPVSGISGSASVTVTPAGTMSTSVIAGPTTLRGQNYKTPITVNVADASTGAPITGANVSLYIYGLGSGTSCPTTQPAPTSAVASTTGTTSSGTFSATFSTRNAQNYCAWADVTDSPNYNQTWANAEFTN